MIPEEGRKVRSQSVGNRVTLKQSNKNSAVDGVDDTRSFFSESLINNISFGKRFRSLDNVHRYSTGTLARPDIFYQGTLSNIPHYRSHNELPTVIENYSNEQINENVVRIITIEKNSTVQSEIPFQIHLTILFSNLLKMYVAVAFRLGHMKRFSKC